MTQPNPNRSLFIQSLMIIFSVSLALILNETRSHFKKKKETTVLLQRIEEEIRSNQEVVLRLEEYHSKVFANAKKAMSSDSIQQKMISENGLNLFTIAPNGIIQEKISSTAWDIAKQMNIATRIDHDLLTLLTETYEQQETIEISIRLTIDIFADRSSHNPEHIKTTTLLLKNAFNELSGQESLLLHYYKKTLEVLNK